MIRTIITVLSIATALCLAANGKAEAGVTCGDVVTGPAVLDSNLVCATFPGFTIDGGDVDMRGFRITGPAGNNCIAIVGDGSKLRNGAVLGCQVGVNISANNVTISDVVARGCSEAGFDGGGIGLRISNSVAVGNQYGFDLQMTGGNLSRVVSVANNTGVIVLGSKTAALDSIAAGNGGAGFLLNGDAMSLTRVTAVGNSNNLVQSNKGRVTRSSFSGSSAFGLRVTGEKAVVSRNQAHANTGIGLELNGVDAQLTNNVAVQNAGSNLQAWQNRVRVRGNRAAGGFSTAGLTIGGGDGFAVSGNTIFASNVGIVANAGAVDGNLSRNTAIGNAVHDLKDSNPSCGGNVWSNNLFRTKNAGCID